MFNKNKRRRPQSDISKRMAELDPRDPRWQRRRMAKGQPIHNPLPIEGHIGPSKYMPHIGNKERGRYAA